MTKNRGAAWAGQPFTLSRPPRQMAGAPTRDRRTDRRLLGRIGFSAEEIAPLRLSTGTLKGSAQCIRWIALYRAHRVA
jgi:hypothetical protein